MKLLSTLVYLAGLGLVIAGSSVTPSHVPEYLRLWLVGLLLVGIGAFWRSIE